MNWTDLQENWVPLSDADKFRKYAKENCIKVSNDDSQNETYYEHDKGISYNNITEINFTNILTNIEEEISRVALVSGLKNTELLSRIVAVTMLKMKPKEITVRERFEQRCKRQNIEEQVFMVQKHEVSSANPEVLETSSNKKDNKPPDFWYPI